MSNPTVSPQSCPKWKTCRAPVCPLDPNYSRCKTLSGDSVCPWLREAVKAGGAGNIPADIAPTVLRVLPILQETGGAALKGKLKRASQCPSRMPPEGPTGYAVRDMQAIPLATPAPHRSSPMRHTDLRPLYMSAFSVTAADYAELLEDDCLSSFERSLYESELRRAMKREATHAAMDEELRAQTLIHRWQQESLRVAKDLLALQWEVAAWDRAGRKPLQYGRMKRRAESVGRGFAKRLARAQQDAQQGSAQQLQFLEDHHELIVAVSREP